MDVLRESDPRRIGPYEVVGRLGSGGMGEVFVARTEAGLRLAVKVVRAEHAEDRTFRARFRQEVQAAQSVGGTGTYTARVVDADTESERPWMATEFVDGPNLRDAVLDHGPLPETTVLTLAAALAEALAAIHAKGMVHRDLKPSNILLAPDGPRVIDFGIVRALEATALTRTGTIVGSVGYVSPEQIRNGAEVAAPSDVFSLGAVLAYASTGRAPFGEGQDSVVLLRILTRDFDLSAVPARVRPLVEACLSAEPAERPTPADVLAATGHTDRTLRERTRPGWLAPEEPQGPEAEPQRWLPESGAQERESRVEYVAPQTVTNTPAPQEPPSRRRFLALAAGGGAAVVGAGVGGWLWLREPGGERDTRGAGGGGTGQGSSSTARTAGWPVKVRGLGGQRGPCAAFSRDGSQVYVGGSDGALRALDVHGATLWRTGLGAPVMSPLVTAGGVYCLLYDNGEGATQLCALDPAGKVLWRRKAAGNSQFPVAAGKLVLVSYGASADTGGVRAHTADGGVAWDTPTGPAPTSEPVVAGGTVYVGTFGDRVLALDATTGKKLWAAPAGIDTGRPTLVGDTLVVGSGGPQMLHGIGRGGKVLWDQQADDVLGGGRYTTTVAFGGLAVGSTDNALVAFDPADGSTAWRLPIGDTSGSGDSISQYSDPVVAGGTLYVRQGAEVFAVNAKGAKAAKAVKTWSSKLSGGAPPQGGTHSPVVRDGRVYVTDGYGVTAVRLPR
ncbi:PQQ-binding-like beta-propeller repeat protein [Streptomyces sp. VRA16 Mangrove soil]|nr:PQQ-binding-like beta-propeller repeat protein [Streptomyces sp. VRA16 Mangrove soil]